MADEMKTVTGTDDFVDFENMGDGVADATEKEETGEKAAKRKAKKEDMQAKVEAFQKKVSDPEFAKRLKKFSGAVSVINTLGYGENGGLILDKKTGNKVPTPKIVGYKLQNISTDIEIPYITEEYEPQKAEDGSVRWVGKKVDKVLKPGETIELTRKYMTFFCSMPEISFELANGKIIRGSANAHTVDEVMEAHYFAFSDSSNKVNSDSIKINIGKKVKSANGTTGWVVKPEYEKAFGFLNNNSTGKTAKKSGGSTKKSYSAQDVNANYIYELFSTKGKM